MPESLPNSSSTSAVHIDYKHAVSINISVSRISKLLEINTGKYTGIMNHYTWRGGCVSSAQPIPLKILPVTLL
jgi:hypothetical protein